METKIVKNKSYKKFLVQGSKTILLASQMHQNGL